MIDLGIVAKYDLLNNEEQEIVREFIGALGNLDRTSVSDDVQMIIRDLLFSHYPLRPFVLLNRTASWEYTDLLPADRFDINPFDIELELDEEGRMDYDRSKPALSLKIISTKKVETTYCLHMTGSAFQARIALKIFLRAPR